MGFAITRLPILHFIYVRSTFRSRRASWKAVIARSHPKKQCSRSEHGSSFGLRLQCLLHTPWLHSVVGLLTDHANFYIYEHRSRGAIG
ncbi:hypothetical protein P171DRAFT_178478 [Karstenula rhodostoma CBS 690.94]|uniref:Uncharacterized protein n=1 Tax=Karstenula rhodostoma CBS 690.94 TaxID=1392251 RepID=A0A9P4P632_9PLEO|nr:hypothetical protein P171DRAFT_178478 [Karstenula rhodostoma CBS 690.94]